VVIVARTFLRDVELPADQREILWSLLGHAMQVALERTSGHFEVVPAVTSVRQLLKPFEHFLHSTGTPATSFELVERSLAGKRSEFPFGVLEVDTSGRITSLTAHAPALARAGS
jgi:hypothetical protein